MKPSSSPVATPSDRASLLATHPRPAVEAALERVVSSTAFRRSERHRSFLRHVVRTALDGHADRLKEVLLGVELFDRELARYDPRHDPVVRVEAGRLRTKLVRYYDGEGADDPLVFSIPVGSYVPTLERRAADRVAARRVESFAVLPFATAGHEDDAAFALGLADQLIQLLSRCPDVKTVARVSALKARERDLGIRDIGRVLRATRVVDGSIQRRGQRLRIIAYIYRTRDAVVLWSGTFDSTTMQPSTGDGDFDVFAFQDAVADVLLAAVSQSSASSSAASSSTAAALPAPRASDERRREARDLLERGRYLARRYDAGHTREVIDLFERSAALDPDNPRTHGALAVAYLHQTTLLNASGGSMLPKIEAALRRTLALDPRDSEAIALEAMIAFRFRFDWVEAERLFDAALRISPYASDVHYRFALCLMFNGRFDEGLAHSRAAIDLDPLNLALRAYAVQLLAFARRYDEAERAAREILEIEPSHLYTNYVLGLVHLYRAEYDAAVAVFDRIVALHPAHAAGCLGRIAALGLRGDVAVGRRELDAWLAGPGARYCPPFSLGMALLGLGDRPAAYAALERGAGEGDASFCSLPIDALFARCHDDPAFIDLLARHGLRSPVPWPAVTP